MSNSLTEDSETLKSRDQAMATGKEADKKCKNLKAQQRPLFRVTEEVARREQETEE